MHSLYTCRPQLDLCDSSYLCALSTLIHNSDQPHARPARPSPDRGHRPFSSLRIKVDLFPVGACSGASKPAAPARRTPETTRYATRLSVIPRVALRPPRQKNRSPVLRRARRSPLLNHILFGRYQPVPRHAQRFAGTRTHRKDVAAIHAQQALSRQNGLAIGRCRQPGNQLYPVHLASAAANQ